MVSKCSVVGICEHCESNQKNSFVPKFLWRIEEKSVGPDNQSVTRSSATNILTGFFCRNGHFWVAKEGERGYTDCSSQGQGQEIEIHPGKNPEIVIQPGPSQEIRILPSPER